MSRVAPMRRVRCFARRATRAGRRSPNRTGVVSPGGLLKRNAWRGGEREREREMLQSVMDGREEKHNNIRSTTHPAHDRSRQADFVARLMQTTWQPSDWEGLLLFKKLLEMVPL